METLTLNLHQRINEIRKKVDFIIKDKSVSTGSSGSYKAVTHDAVTGILRKYLIDFGVICIPNLVTSKANDRVGDAKQFRYDATYSFMFVNADKPDETLTIIIEAHAMDNADKAPGKALSYAKKYAVLKLFEIETGDDEEKRYGYGLEDIMDEGQLCDYIAAITASTTKQDVGKHYLSAINIASELKDQGAMDRLNVAKVQAFTKIKETK